MRRKRRSRCCTYCCLAMTGRVIGRRPADAEAAGRKYATKHTEVLKELLPSSTTIRPPSFASSPRLPQSLSPWLRLSRTSALQAASASDPTPSPGEAANSGERRKGQLFSGYATTLQHHQLHRRFKYFRFLVSDCGHCTHVRATYGRRAVLSLPTFRAIEIPPLTRGTRVAHERQLLSCSS